MTRAFNAAAGIPWAIYAPALQTILEIAARAETNAAVIEEWKSKLGPAALIARPGPQLFTGSQTIVRDGVAIVPITGPIFPRANLMTASVGASSLQSIALEFQAALDNPNVRAILLDIDSPGGIVAGIHEFAGQVRAAADKKPVAAYIGGLGASAAYWIAAAASEIVVDATAVLGSIGVVTAVDVQENPDQSGRRTIEIVSSNAPNKRPDARSDSGAAEIRRSLDAIEHIFHSDIAAFRGITTADVVERFGRGGLRVGAEAVAAGMADRTGNFEDLLATLAAAQPAPAPALIPAPAPASALGPGSLSATGNQETTMTDKTKIDLLTPTAPPPATVAAPAAPAAPAPLVGADAVLAERGRVLGIQQHTLAGHETLAAAAIEQGTALADFLAQQTAAESRHRAQARASLAADATSPNPPATAAPAAPLGAIDAQAPLEERCQAKWDASEALRAEFGGDAKAYLAFERADAAGRVKILRNKAA